MKDHTYYEELGALAASGFLSDLEQSDLREHTATCADCRTTEAELTELFRHQLPLTVSPFREFLDKFQTRPDDQMRARFLLRARREGLIFSPDVEGSTRHHARQVGVFAAAATGLITAIVILALNGIHWRHISRESAQAPQQFDQLKRENAALTASLSQLNGSVAAQRSENQNLRAQLENLAATAESLRRNSEQARVEAERSSSRNVQLLEDSRSQEKLLAEAKDEAARSSQLRIYDEASMVEQQAHITDLTNKLRIASATLDQERQLAAAGKDVRELMASRQLHVIDVHDTDANGSPSKAFGRVFLTEGKSLTFYAFDLNEEKVANAKSSFQVWAVPEVSKNSARSLGFLRADAKAQGRWVLRVDSPELVKDISSVFVSVDPSAGSKQPAGQKMLFAYLGDANHP